MTFLRPNPKGLFEESHQFMTNAKNQEKALGIDLEKKIKNGPFFRMTFKMYNGQIRSILIKMG
jgi:hypothetical protein